MVIIVMVIVCNDSILVQSASIKSGLGLLISEFIHSI